MYFCELPHDEKTFRYFKKYVEETPLKDILKIDNEIQAEEIRKHCLLNGIPEDDLDEQVAWVNTHAKKFRIYINTIELAQIVWFGSGKNWGDITYKEFCKVEDNINEMKKSGILEKIIKRLKDEFFD